MDPLNLIEEYYLPGSLSRKILIAHCDAVMKKSIKVANRVPDLNPDLLFIKEAAMLHDIGIFMTNEPEIGCYGEKRYICHGYLGRELLEKAGFPRHGLVCERHVGVGLTVTDIKNGNLPLPSRDMVPVSIEEKIICFADKFFSKKEGLLQKEKSVDEVKDSISRYGPEKSRIFEEMLLLFNR